MNRKLFALVGLFAALVFAGSARTADAQTSTAELEAQVTALLAQIAQLQGGASAAGCYSYTRDLTVGAQGADVTALQNYLAAGGYFKVAATGYFGPITQAAVAAWQAANGVTPAAGYFGPISRAKYNSLCGGVVVGDDDDDDDDDSGDDDDDFDSGDGEEASLEDYDARDGEDTDLEEGDEEAEVMEFEFDVEDSDVEVQRVQINASSSSGNDEEDPWDVFEAASLWFDGEEVASVEDLDDEDNWDEESTDGEYSFRFNGVDVVVGEGETAEFILAMTVQDNLDDLPEGWDLFIDDEGIRALDEAGIDQYIGDDTDVVSVDLEEAGADTELNLSESSENPDSMVLEVEDSETSDEISVAMFELSADGDVELRDFVAQVAIGTTTGVAYSSVVNDAVLVIDGEEYDDFSVSSGGTATATLTFDLDDEDIVIADGEEVEGELKLEFKAQDGNYLEGTTVVVDITSALWDTVDAEDADSGEELSATQLTGSFAGERHTLREEGIEVVLNEDGTSAVSPVGGNEARGDFAIEFEVTAFGSNFFIPKALNRSNSAATTTLNYGIEDSNGSFFSSATNTSAVLDVDDNNSGDTSSYYKVNEGDTRTFTLEVTYLNYGNAQGFYSLQIYGMAFDTDTSAGGEQVLGSNIFEDFETEPENIQSTDAAN